MPKDAAARVVYEKGMGAAARYPKVVVETTRAESLALDNSSAAFVYCDESLLLLLLVCSSVLLAASFFILVVLILVVFSVS